ncbi:hypothetical protein CGLO_15075 [Colletotrichum gloeosporioides Cg-14]|uniref:Uncharacterized protein n=1 Tax=Colletotrichum gloeosporioides (strain Cg-14) TaxID=1237896 RepID=T0K2N3_COLGC|nr:hypothetical protein CGLO_15075 [Colletotrichum gloeosporioides Cg-14]
MAQVKQPLFCTGMYLFDEEHGRWMRLSSQPNGTRKAIASSPQHS